MSYLLIFFCIFLSFAGFAGLWSSVASIRQSTQAASWPQAQGILTNVDLKEDPAGDGSTYEVEVKYTYTVGEQTFTGSRLAIAYSGDGDYQVHDEIYRKLKNAKLVDVRYDPQNPAFSVLSFGIHRSLQFSLWFSILFITFSLGTALFIWMTSGSDSVLLNNLSVQ